MTSKAALLSVLSDQAVLENIRHPAAGPSPAGAAALESTHQATFEGLLGGDTSLVTTGAYNRTEAIILLQGRPALLIQDDVWEDPDSAEILNRLAPAQAALKQVIPRVGRVEITNLSADYIGTGWMLEDDVLITNRHVAEVFAERRGSTFAFRTTPSGQRLQARVDFKREHRRHQEAQATVREVVFLEERSDLRPDLALVRLESQAGSLPQPVELDSEIPHHRNSIAVIGYPARDSRNDSFVMDDIFRGTYNVKRLSPGWIIGVRQDGKLLEHDCTTLGGNSGSLVFNLETGKACGLHFAGTYLDRNFAVSALWLRARLAELGRPTFTVPDSPEDSSASPAEPDPSAATPPPAGGGAPPTPPLPPSSGGVGGTLGYREDFLGNNSFRVGLPRIGTDLEGQIAPVRGRQDGLLEYTHFTVCMRADRRLAFYTAANIDGRLLYNFTRGRDQWSAERRLADPAHQITEELYRNNPLDRGHLVRPLDPAWGRTRSEAQRAERDTFFFTNCSPQHANLNQRTWLSLEDYILGNAGTHDLKVSVFTGPVMAETDRTYRDVKLPEEFWKVAVILNRFTGRLSATGYLLSQTDYLADLEFAYGAFRTYQVPIRLLEDKTGLRFALDAYDPLAHTEARPEREISGADDIVL